MQNIHRIYTEKKNEKAIIRVVAEKFDNFTLQLVTGYYRGKAEKSIVVEIVGASASEIRKLGETIRLMNGQKSILVIHSRADAKSIRW